MELFYADNVASNVVNLSKEDSLHCVKVLRHRAGDAINVIDGMGTMYECRLVDASASGASADIICAHTNWGSHPYKLTMGVCPTKNNDRYEWFIEKSTETGVDTICPLIGERSERKVYKTDRAHKIALSAAKQSLKAAVPCVDEPVSVRDFLNQDRAGLKLIAYCFEDESAPRKSVKEALEEYLKTTDSPEITILIGPEGDFSPAEATLALKQGYVPIHLGNSRFRTETAAVSAAMAVYYSVL